MSMKLPTGISRRLVRHRLSRCAATISEVREELRVSLEQFDVLQDDANDTGLRAIVAETPLAEAEFSEARSHFEAMQRHVVHLRALLETLEREQDSLLDELSRDA
jgi:hypothetical protein